MIEFTRVSGVAAALTEGEVSTFAVDDTPVAVVRSAGRLFAFQDRCSHADCPLSPGGVVDGEIECECHGGRFDLATGAATALPASEPIIVYPVEEDGPDILVAVQR